MRLSHFVGALTSDRVKSDAAKTLGKTTKAENKMLSASVLTEITRKFRGIERLPVRYTLRNIARESLSEIVMRQQLAIISVSIKLTRSPCISVPLSSSKTSISRFVLTSWLVFPDGKKVGGG